MTTYDTPVRTVQIPTWTRGTVMKVWAAAAVPMAILAWVVAPLLARTFSGPAALPRALILTLGAGLIWQFALVLIVVRREQGSLRWPVLKKALWLNAPISPRTGKREQPAVVDDHSADGAAGPRRDVAVTPHPGRPGRRSLLRL